MFFCRHCGHAESVHYFFTGRCIHGELGPKDGTDCDCPKMDFDPSKEA